MLGEDGNVSDTQLSLPIRTRVGLIACSGTKLDHPAPARVLLPIEVPMVGMGIGEQLGWLKRQLAEAA